MMLFSFGCTSLSKPDIFPELTKQDPGKVLVYDGQNQQKKEEKKEAPEQEKEKPPSNISPIWGPKRPLTPDVRLLGKTEDNFLEGCILGLFEDHHGKVYLVQYGDKKFENGDSEKYLNLGLRLFPKKFNDKLELKLVGGRDFAEKNTKLGGYFTWRDNLSEDFFVKGRVGVEKFFLPTGENKTAYIASVRTKYKEIGLNGIISNITEDNNNQTKAGIGLTYYISENLFLSSNFTRNLDSEIHKLEGLTRTFSLGRYASMRGEKYPTGFVIYRGNEMKTFLLGGLMMGGKQKFVEPAAIGMSEGFFFGSGALSELSDLRRFNDFGVLSTNYEIANLVLWLMSFNQKIAGTELKVGVKEADIYWTPPLKFFSDNGIHIDFVYGKTTTPNFRTMSEEEGNYSKLGFGFNLGKKVQGNILWNLEDKGVKAFIRIYDFKP